jgi:hypothetical protein
MYITVQKPLASQRYWVLDFDRCLGDVDVLFRYFTTVIDEHYGVRAEELVSARRRTEKSRGSFDVIGYLLRHDVVSESELDALGDEYAKRCADDPLVVLPGTRDFLAFLQDNYPERYGILTFGNSRWQRMKLKAAGLDNLPCRIAGTPYKAREIASWYDEAKGGYQLPQPFASAGEMITEVVLVDDKIVAFEDRHPSTTGYLVSSDLRMDDGRVCSVGHLGEIINIEQHK